jgi:hypothetical protein
VRVNFIKFSVSIANKGLYENFLIELGFVKAKNPREKFMKSIQKMRRNGFLLAFTLGLILLQTLPNVLSWSDGKIMTSSPSAAPIIDGQMGNEWRGAGVNNTYATLEGNRPINLLVLHNGSNIYFMVHVRFETTIKDEAIAIYISKNNSLSEDAYLDRKVILLTNATEVGNESVVAIKDYHRNPDSASETKWLEDTDETVWNASAGLDDRKYRVYEFQIPLSPNNNTEDVKIEVSQQYTVMVGLFQNHNYENEIRSNKIIIQVGPKGLQADEEIGEFKIDPQEFITVMIIIIAVAFGIWGILLAMTKSKVGSLALREVDEGLESEESEETKEKEPEKKEKNQQQGSPAKKGTTAKKGGKN